MLGDRLFDLLLASLRFFQFWSVCDAYERGVVLRLGRFHRLVDPGIVWLIPFGVDRCVTDNVVPRTVDLGQQTLTTRDGRTVTLQAVVTARIHDVQKALLEVEHMDDALKDSCAGEIGRVVSETTWEDLWHGTLDLTKPCRARGWKYGIEIIAVQLRDAAPSKSLRVWTH